MFDLPSSSVAISLAKDWIPKLLDKVIAKRAERHRDIDALSNEFGDPTELVSLYVEPDCQHFTPSDFEEDEDLDLVRQPVFSRLAQFFSGPPKARNTRLLVLADAGVGKTSLLIMIKLAHFAGLWHPIRHCALLKLGPDVLDKAEQLPHKTQTILLLDALDEDPLAWGRVNTRLIELLANTTIFFRVVITCRTQFFEGDEDPFHNRGRVELGGYIFPLIFLSLFSREQVAEYLEKRFPANKLATKRALGILKQMKSLQCRPMLLAHIEDLVESEVDDWTEYTVYDALVTAWLQRECRKLATREQKQPTVKDLWKACRDVALRLHTTGQYTISETDLARLISNNPDIRHVMLFDIKGRSLLNRNTQGQFRFAHRSIAEFLIADAIIKQDIVTDATIRPTDQLFAFILAWMSHQPLASRAGLPLKVLTLAGMDLRELDLRHTDLSGADLSDSRLNRCVMSSANLVGASLRGAQTVLAQLERAVIRHADFTAAQMPSAVLTRCAGDGARFFKANLAEAVADNAVMDGCHFDSASLEHSNFVRAYLRGVSAKQANLTSANWSSAQLAGAVFDNAMCQETNFSYASLSGTSFKATKLMGANLAHVEAPAAVFEYADMTGATLESATLDRAHFRHSILVRCNLRHASLTGADLQHAKLQGADLRNADLTNANLEFVDGLRDVDLTGAITVGARLPK
jgi:uncharacterized protein YjbI with pentapeptide repeats